MRLKLANVQKHQRLNLIIGHFTKVVDLNARICKTIASSSRMRGKLRHATFSRLHVLAKQTLLKEHPDSKLRKRWAGQRNGWL